MTSSSVILPPGWMEARDPNTGGIYYANPTTGESSWQVPMSLPLPPPQQQHDTATIANTTMSRPPESSSSSSSSSSNQHTQYSRIIHAARELTIQQASATNNAHHHNSHHHSMDLEFQSITPGQLADLVQITKRLQSKEEEEAETANNYQPINPYSLPDQLSEELMQIISDTNNITMDDSKLTDLLEQLKEFGYQPQDPNPFVR